MIIREEQKKALSQAVLRAFENEMVTHLAAFSPPLFKAVKEDQLRKTIRFGIKRGGEYGITFRGPVRLYLELMLLFGSHFDSDPQYPWATEILQDRKSAPQMQRAELLYQQTCDYRQKVAGPQDGHTLGALRRISILAQQPLAVSLDNFNPAMREAMAEVYPQKTAYVGAAALEALIHKGWATARRYEFSTVRAMALPAVLMFAFGHGCFDDPLYPWIGRTVEDESITDPEARARRLERKAVTWLNHVLGYFDGGDKT